MVITDFIKQQVSGLQVLKCQIGKVVSPQDAVDIVLDFNETAYGEIENITINTPSEYPD